MFYHLLFLFYIFFITFSVIGYGLLFSKIIDKRFLKLNIGYQGLLGIFFLSLISILTSYFISHGYSHNIILHFIGFLIFVITLKKNFLFSKIEIKNLLFLMIFTLVGLYIYKNHDDFPYYHLTYALNLSENNFIIGSGAFSHGFRTFSSLFYFNSLTYLPGLKYFLFHLYPYLIILFFNYIILKEILFKHKKNFIHFFNILIFLFANIVFYRIAEHGTDRSAQILLLLIFSIMFEILYFKKIEFKNEKVKFLFIIIFLAASLKSLYLLYFILIPFILFKIKKLIFFVEKNNFKLSICLFIFISNIFIINLINTGCLLYPSSKTCFNNLSWSIPKEEVKIMKTHYEWWSKAGGGPNYKNELSKEEYNKDFNWVLNWIDRHFFNKVSDTLSAIFIFSLILFIYFKSKKKEKNNNKKKNIIYFLIFIFLLEWFINHPSMRYGGFVLFAIPIFLFTSEKISNYKINKKKLVKGTFIFVMFTLLIFNGRNINRIYKEISIYDYNIVKSPYFYVPIIKSKIIAKNGEFNIYTPLGNKMCWAVPTPCSYAKNLQVRKYLNTFIVKRKKND